MTWQLAGSLRFVRFEVDAEGRRSLEGYAKAAFTFDSSDPRNAGFPALVERLPGARYQSLPGAHAAGALTNLLSQWKLHSTGAPTPWPASDPLHQAVLANPAASHIAADLDGATTYRAAMTVRMALPPAHFEVVFGLFQESLGYPRVRYAITLAEEFHFPARAAIPGVAASASEFLAGAPLLISPASVSLTIRPPRRSGATRAVPPAA